MWNYLEKALCFWGGFWQVNILTWTNGKHNKSHFQRRLRAVKATKMKWTKILERERESVILGDLMIGSNFSLRVSVSSGNTQLVWLDPGRGTLLGSENPAKSMVITRSSGSMRRWRWCLVSTLYCNLPPSLRTQKMKTGWGKNLSQYTPHFFLKRCIKSWGCMRQDTDEEDVNFCTFCNQLVLKGRRVTMLAMK